jgi:aminomethyltransferase
LESKGDCNGTQIAKWIGLGARDSLRLEAGLCLYGHDLNEDTSPVEGMLNWTISKRRRESGGFIGSDVIKKQLAEGVSRKRSGFIVEGTPAREGADIFLKNGQKVGTVTSGAPSPSLKKSIGQAYIDVPHNKLETELAVNVRGKLYPLIVKKMPFVPHRYYKRT